MGRSDGRPAAGADAAAEPPDPAASEGTEASEGTDAAADGTADPDAESEPESEPNPAPDRSLGLSPREWGYAVLLSVPPGVGAAVGIDTTLRTGLFAPIALAAGAATALTAFALVVAGVGTGTVDESLSPRDP